MSDDVLPVTFSLSRQAQEDENERIVRHAVEAPLKHLAEVTGRAYHRDGRPDGAIRDTPAPDWECINDAIPRGESGWPQTASREVASTRGFDPSEGTWDSTETQRALPRKG